VRAAVGQAQLMLTKRLHQFRALCHLNMDIAARPSTTNDDLAGFWDLISYDHPPSMSTSPPPSPPPTPPPPVSIASSTTILIRTPF